MGTGSSCERITLFSAILTKHWNLEVECQLEHRADTEAIKCPLRVSKL